MANDIATAIRKEKQEVTAEHKIKKYNRMITGAVNIP